MNFRALSDSRAFTTVCLNGQVAALIAEKGILELEAPIGRVDAPDTPYPFSEAEESWLPNKNDIIKKVKEIVNF